MICTATKERKQSGCVNLMERFGRKYRIGFDPAYDPKGKHQLDPWMMQIPCRFGTIYPHGGDWLAIEIDGHRIIRKRLERLGCIQTYTSGDGDGTFLFRVDDLPKVAKLVHPHRKARLTPEQRQAAADRLRAYHFQPGSTAASGANSTLERVPTVSDV